jgi:hypothetical protein
MTRSGTHSNHKANKQHIVPADSDAPSSFGDSPVQVTPKDVNPEDATARDTTERQVAPENAAEHKDAILDEAVELTFPASDPIAPSSVTKISPQKDKDKEEKNKK